MNPGLSRAVAWFAAPAAVVAGVLLVRHALIRGGNGIGYVAGVELLLAAAVVAAVISPLARRRRRLGVAIAIAAVVATLAIVLPAATRPSPVETAGSSLVGTSRWAEPFGSSILATSANADFTGFATFDSIREHPTDLFRGDTAIVGADGASRFVFDRDGTITSIGDDGTERWSVDVAADDTEARLRPVAAFADGAVAGLVNEGGDLVVLDPDGGERWRVSVPAEFYFVNPTSIRPVAEASSVIVGVVDPDGNGPYDLHEFDPETGERREFASSADGFVLGPDFVGVLDIDGEACTLEILGPGLGAIHRVDVACPGGDVSLSWGGGPVQLVAGDIATLVDPVSGAVEEFRDSDDVVTHLSVIIEESGGRFRRVGGDAVTYGGWSFEDADGDILVLRRDVHSRNPFRSAGDDDRDEIAVVDLGTGLICARSEVAGWWVDAIALPGCRALLNDQRSGTTWLVGPDSVAP